MTLGREAQQSNDQCLSPDGAKLKAISVKIAMVKLAFVVSAGGLAALICKPADAKFRPADAECRPAEAEFKPADGKFKPADAECRPADAKFKPANAKFRPADAKFTPADAEFKPADGKFKPADGKFKPYRATSQTEREKGSYFEELVRTYLRFEASYADLYSDVWLYSDWAKEIGTPEFGLSAKDTGIDLVAKTRGTGEYHAIQCKCYAEDYRVRKADIDSFFTASGQKPFTQRIIVTTTNDWSDNAENALANQQPPVFKIDLNDLENSQIDWAKYQPSTPPPLKPKKQLRPHQKSAQTKVGLGFQTADRGKLIMACGTGKTFTSLKIAETPPERASSSSSSSPASICFPRPSPSGPRKAPAAAQLRRLLRCRGRQKAQQDDDIVETFAHELRYPATTDAKRLAHEVKKRHDAQHMSVIFSTYHSSTSSAAPKRRPAGDRPRHLRRSPPHHRSHLRERRQREQLRPRPRQRLHQGRQAPLHDRHPAHLRGCRQSPGREGQRRHLLHGRRALYGKQFHVITFSEAVELKLLTDYKVLVLTIDEDHVSSRICKPAQGREQPAQGGRRRPHHRLLESPQQAGPQRRPSS
jgi:hypothetical protein